MWCKYIKQKSQPFVIQMIAIYFVLEAGTQPNNHKKIREYKRII